MPSVRKLFVAQIFVCFSSALIFAQQDYTVETVAGFLPDNESEAASEAVLVNPTTSAMDSEGNLYFFDSSPARIRKITIDGAVRTIAYQSGEHLCVGPGGTIYFSIGPYVYKLRPDGGKSIFAGSVLSSRESADRIGNVAGLAADGSGRVYISDSSNKKIWAALPDGTVLTMYTPPLVRPGRIAISKSGDVYFVDGYTIRSLNRGVVVAGNGEFGTPESGREATKTALGILVDLAVNSKGELYFVDGTNRLVMRVATGGSLETVLDGGQGSSSERPFDLISAIEFDSKDQLLLLDRVGRVIRRLDESGGLTSMAGRVPFSGDDGPATEALLNQPVDVEVGGDGSVIVVDQRNNRLRRISPDGMITTIAGTGGYGSEGDGGPAVEATLRNPSLAQFDRDGNLYFVDGGTRIRRIGTDGIITTVAGGDEATYSGDGGPAADARFASIVDLAIDSNGNIYVSDQRANRVRRINPDGYIETVAGTGERGGVQLEAGPGAVTPISPGKMAVDPDGSVWINDEGVRQGEGIHRLDPGGQLIPAYWPRTTDLSNNEGLTVCAFQTITAMAIDAGGLIASDGFQICRMGRDGKLAHLGGGRAGLTGDGGPGKEAKFSGVQALALNAQGDIYVADTGNQRIRKLARRE